MNHPRRTKTAYHEAGHAVIGRILTLASGPATIKPDHKEGIGGAAAAVPPQDWRTIASGGSRLRGGSQPARYYHRDKMPLNRYC